MLAAVVLKWELLISLISQDTRGGKQGIAPAETKLSFVKPSIILYCPHLVPDASLLVGEIRSQPLPQRIWEQRR